MAKTRAYTEEEAPYVTFITHWPYEWMGYKHTWHAIYPYYIPDIPYYWSIVGAWITQPTLEQAQLCAHTLVSLPELVKDLCVYCHPWYGWSPTKITDHPRWNIYRGQNQILAFPGIHPPEPMLIKPYYWDIGNFDNPPPGQHY
jgi:hypothetical protein